MSIDTFKANFGGYLLATVVVLVAYSAVDALAPQYSTPLALITLMGVILFYFKRKT